MSARAQLAIGSPEAAAVAAGEIDAIVDYAKSNVYLLPAAKRAMRVAEVAETRAPNHLLAALAREDYRILAARLERVTLKAGAVIKEPGARIDHVYFPIDCVVAFLATAEGGRALAVGQVGYEGMIGVPLALGSPSSSIRAIVQAGGTALRMNAAAFTGILERCASVRRELIRYAGAEVSRARRNAACICFHTIDGRLACSLLMTSDRVRAETFYATQLALAQMLGVLRTTVNIAAGVLLRSRLIDICRGNVRILNRPGLTAAACACYRPIAR